MEDKSRKNDKKTINMFLYRNPATAPTNPGASEPNRRTTGRYDTAVI